MGRHAAGPHHRRSGYLLCTRRAYPPSARQAHRHQSGRGLKNAHVFGHDVDRLSQTIMTFARRLLDSGWTITWFPTTQDDADEMRRLIARANLPPMAIMSDFLNIPAMLDRLKEQDIFVGQRLHSVVAASSVYVPVLALEYQLKCRDFMMSIDQEDAVIRTDTVEAAELFDRVQALYDHHEQVQQRVYQSVQSLRRNLLEGSRTVKSLIR
ncbi:MAG: polysaccharide pyruvyl transferase family protein [Chloroflexi bacterium]|nr:polysaccharide pyruvyl transferase family protein [Chloroflexota bacterium]